MRTAASAMGTGVGSSRASGLPCLPGVPLLVLVFSGRPAPKGFTIIPDFDFGVNASREGPIETIAQSSRQSVIWHEMVMSEHVFVLRAKTFDNKLRHDQHQVQNFGTKKVPGWKNQKIVSSVTLSFPMGFFGSSGFSDDTKIA